MTTPHDRELEDRLVRYTAVSTQSDPGSDSRPSTACQLDLQHILKAELEEMGASDVTLTEYGALLATLPATDGVTAPVMGWLAHVDTAPQFNATGVKPRVHRAYDGGEITFPDAPELVLSPENAPLLGDRVGHDIVTASGLTLLGADDKAGVAIVMTAARHLLAHPEIARGPIRLALTCDEEIGRGVEAELEADLGADFAFTFDGAEPGGLEWETFSADGATVTITGVSIHPGDAKDVMVNATTLASRLLTSLPQDRTPERTEGREGFIMCLDVTGSAAEVVLHLILRDYERDGLAELGTILTSACDRLAADNPRAKVRCEITPQYRNMRYWLEDDMRAVDLARAAYRARGLEPVSEPVRGGTDGSRLTEFGTPCPNIFTGMQNVHGPLEWISVQDMGEAVGVAVKLAQLAAEAKG